MKKLLLVLLFVPLVSFGQSDEEFYNSGRSKDNLNDYKGAIADYTKAIELNPNFTDAYVNRGIDKHRLGDKKGACADVRKAVSLGYSDSQNFIRNVLCNEREGGNSALADTQTNETNQEEIVEIEEVEIEEEYDDVDVPFAVIEDPPIFPGCEGIKKSALRKCFQDQINKHIRKNFRYPDIAQEMGIQGRVYVSFIINKDGSIGNIRVRGPAKILEKEAHRITAKLPKMSPGFQRGRPVRVPFSFPITFRLN